MRRAPRRADEAGEAPRSISGADWAHEPSNLARSADDPLRHDDLEVVVFFGRALVGGARWRPPTPPRGIWDGDGRVAERGRAQHRAATSRTQLRRSDRGGPRGRRPSGFRGATRETGMTRRTRSAGWRRGTGDRVLLATNAADATRPMRRFRETTCAPRVRRRAAPGRDARLRRRGTRGRFLGSAATETARVLVAAFFPDRAKSGAAVGGGAEPTVSPRVSRSRDGRCSPPLGQAGAAARRVATPRRASRARTRTSPWRALEQRDARGVPRGEARAPRRDAAGGSSRRSDLDPRAVMAQPERAGDGTAESRRAPAHGSKAATFGRALEDENASGRTGRNGRNVQAPAASAHANDAAVSRSINAPRRGRPRRGRRRSSMDRTRRKRAGAGAPSRRASGTTTTSHRTDSRTKREKTAERGKATADARGAWYRGPTNRSTTARSTNANVLTRVVSARAVDRENVSVGECPRARAAPRDRRRTRPCSPGRSCTVVDHRRRGGTTRRRATYENVSVTGAVTRRRASSRDFENEGARDEKRVASTRSA